jgi:hypothetical protein
MLERACQWIDSQLAHLGDGDAMAVIKAAGDLAHGADFLQRSGHSEIATRWMTTASNATAGGDSVRKLIAQNPLYAPALVTLLPLVLSGRVSPNLVAGLRLPHADELPPLAWVMLVPTLECFGVTPTPEMIERANRISVLAHRTPAHALPADAAYVLAHECLYLTRLGRTAMTDAYVEAVLPELAARCVAARDADLLAEIIVAMHIATPACVEQSAWQLLAAAQTAAGNVESPTTLPTMFARLQHPALARTFHTTLVSIMAWASCAHERVRV